MSIENLKDICESEPVRTVALILRSGGFFVSLNMAIRIRKVGVHTIALCAAISEAKEGDIYLDDNDHHALYTKFALDMQSEGFLERSLEDEVLVPLMRQEQGGKLV